MSDLAVRIAGLSAEKRALLARRLQQSERAAVPISTLGPRVDRGSYPLSFAQERLWFLDRWAPDQALYNSQTELRLAGRFDTQAFARAIDGVFWRHEVLRASFSEVDGKPEQAVAPFSPPYLVQVDLSGLPARASRPESLRLAAEEARRPFHLERGPMLRAVLVRLATRENHLLLTMHHIATDGWSWRVLLRQIAELYRLCREGLPLPPGLPIQYADYAAWQREQLSGEVFARQMAFWRDVLRGASELRLPTDRSRPAMPSLRGASEPFILSAEIWNGVQSLSRRPGVTPFMTLLAAFQGLLSRSSGQSDVVVGTPVAGRSHPATHELIGVFINLLVMRNQMEGDPEFSILLERVHQAAVNAYAHQDLPFEGLVEALQPARDASRPPLFQVLFVVQGGDPEALPALSGLELAAVEAETVVARYDWTLTLTPGAQAVECSLDYATDLFDRATIRRFVSRFRAWLSAVVADPSRRLSELPVLSDTERHQATVEWNDSAAAYELERPLPAWLALQAHRTPDAVAVVSGERQLSFGALVARSARLAARLRASGVGPEVLVGLCAERSLEMVIGLAGILAAGGAYVPLDPGYPTERLTYMLSDAQAPVLLAQEHLLAGLTGLPPGAQTMSLEAALTEDDALAARCSWDEVSPDNLAYVIYTSGSTGRPKGAMNTHRGVVNRLLWMQSAYGLSPADRVLQKTPFGFDVSVWEFFWPLMVGARLVLARPDGHRDPTYLADLIAEQGVTLLHFVPSMLQAFVEEPGLARCGSLGRVVASGEALPPDLVARFLARLGPQGVELHNLYGPTEAAVDVTAQRCETAASPISIGRPIANCRILLLDAGLHDLPLGMAAELLIGGIQVARGYWRRPDLTAEKFIPDPSPQALGARLYRTGDLARHRGDGSIEYLGRLDHQVKIRGFRIELSEIESALVGQPEVREAVVMARGEGLEQRLVAYVVPSVGCEVSVAKLRRALSEILPEYMVPSALVTLSAIPLSPNGKVDRRALPEVEQRQGEDIGRPPRTATEALVSGIWEEVLDRTGLGVDESFFNLGGHSLLATRVVARLARAFGVEVSLQRFFAGPTVAQVAAAIDRARQYGEQMAAPPLVSAGRSRPLPLSFSQERLWFLQQFETGAAYHLPVELVLEGELDEPALQDSLSTLIARHEVLRSTFSEVAGAPAQRISPPSTRLLPVVDLASLPALRRPLEAQRLTAENAEQPFDLEAGPVLRIYLTRFGPGEWMLLLNIHHIAADGWSMAVLVREVIELYQARRESRPAILPTLAVQYADFAVWQREWLAGEELTRQLSWWESHLLGAPAVLALPTDRPRRLSRTLQSGHRSLTLPAATGAAVHAMCRRAVATPFMVLLSIFALLLERSTGQEDQVIGTPIANRTRPELESLIGCFVNMLALRVNLAGDPTFGDLVARVRAMALDAYAHQDLPFEKLVEELRPERDLAHHPVFQSVFALQNVPVSEASLPGLAIRSRGTTRLPAKFDLAVVVEEAGDGFSVVAEYDSDLFDGTTIDRFLASLERLVGSATADSGQRISSLELLTGGERHQLLVEWNDTAQFFPLAPVHQLVADRAERSGDSIALSFGAEQMTYGELRARSRELAACLHRAGIGSESIVALCLERSTDWVVGMLAVLETGGAYLPLDVSHPVERIAYLLADAGCQIVISRQNLVVPSGPWRRLDLNETAHGRSIGWEASSAVDHEQLAYVIYTSGSTGRPKGVAVRHGGFANLVSWHLACYPLTPGERVSQVASAAFDASVWEIWPALVAGACLCLADEEIRSDSELLAGWLVEERIGIAFAPTPVAEALLQVPWPEGTALATLLTGGDTLRRRPAPGTVLRTVNHYGPTEGTVVATAGDVEAGPSLQAPSIGSPISNVRIYVADARLGAVPVGAQGELLIGGASLARGYLGKPDLTAERFVPDPWGPLGARLYRTGDLVRWQQRGNLQFLGRVDRQVKVRGFRIELDEIEAAVLALHDVREVVVEAVADRPGEHRLVAYVVVEPGGWEAARLRAALSERLPRYMVPAAWVLLPALPLTANGKLDRRALTRLSPTASPQGGVAFRTPTEIILAQIWCDVLAVDSVEIGDDFFALGGHSLLATRVVSRARSLLGAEIRLRTLFEAPTLRGMAAAIEEARVTGKRMATPPLMVADRDRPLPLSFAQERLWFLDRLEPKSISYNIPITLRVSGALDLAALSWSLGEVVRRHDSLRTRFDVVNGEPVQVVEPAFRGAVPLVDLSGLASGQIEARRLAAAESRRAFDLARGPLLRVAVLRLAASTHVVLMTLHHVVADDWSIGVLVRELGELYPAAAAGHASSLSEPLFQYADFAIWQRDWLSGQALDERLAFWCTKLRGAAPVLPLPTDRPRPAGGLRQAGFQMSSPVPDLASALREVCRRESATSFMVLLAVLQSLFFRYSGQGDVSIGTPTAGRDQLELEGLIGLFVNTLVMRSTFESETHFHDLLVQVRESVLEGFARQDLPFEKLVEALQPVRSLTHTPLFQVLLNMQNAPRTTLDLPGLKVEPFVAEAGSSKFDLNLAVTDSGDSLSLGLSYDRSLFDGATAVRFLEHFEALLAGVAAAPTQAVGDLPLLSPGQRHQMLREWTPVPGPQPAGGCLHELVAAWAALTPDSPAVVAGETVLTYRQLDRQAQRLARRLRARGIGPDTTIGLCAERSVEMVIGMLGTLQAGGSYVPLDPVAPPAHLAHIVAEMRPAVVLAQQACAFCLQGTAVDLLLLDTSDPAGPDSGDPAPAGTLPEHLAYVIYTSGSTGRPKGVMQTHRAITNHLLARQAVQPLNPGDSFLQQAAFSFEMSTWEVFWPLISGARLVLARPGGQRDAADLVETIVRMDIDALRFTPAMLALITEQAGVERCRSLRHVHTGAEPLSLELAGRTEQLVPGVTVHHHYGPTETCIAATLFTGDRRLSYSKFPIGRSFAGADLFVVDWHLAPVPPGVVGELYIGGQGLARGYLGRPDLTAERFLPHPWSGLPGQRLYRTGDLVRWYPDGNLDFIGRTDHQVKIRGYRVELGEVEWALAAHPGVAQAVAVALERRGELQLVGYVVLAPGTRTDAEDLRTALRRTLPEPLVPAAVVVLPELPLTANGKVDRRALPAPEGPRRDGVGVLPRTPAEELVAEIWAEVLGLEEVGVEESFFDLGGHSLLAMKVVSRLTRVFGVELPLHRLFSSPTPAGLAAAVEEARTAGNRSVTPPPVAIGRDRPLPLSFAQERLWFLDRLEPGSAAYNMPAALRVTGALDLAALVWSLGEVVRRHEVLRTRFDLLEGRPVQVIEPAAGLAVPLVDLSSLSAGEGEARRLAAAEAERSFELARGPLIRAAALRLAAGSHVLLVTLHHAVADGWSIGVLVRELGELVLAAAAGAASPLPEPPLQYADFAVWQRHRLTGEALDELLVFWHRKLAGAAPVLPLPTDRPRMAGGLRRTGFHVSSPTPGLLSRLRELGRRETVTPFMLLLAAFQALLFRYSGQGDVSIGTPTAGRDRQELEGLIGLFVNTLVMRSTFAGETRFHDLLQQVRETVLEGFAHQDLPFEKLVEALQPVRSLTHTPLFQILLNMQNAPRTVLELPGLRVEPFGEGLGSSKFDLNLSVSEAGESLSLGLSFDRTLFDAATAVRLLDHFESLLAAVAAAPERAIGELPLLAPAARHQVVAEWGEAACPPAPVAPVHRLIAEQAARAPDAIAVVFEDRHLTYGELERRSHGLAARLHKLGVGAESAVGICAERSETMVVALLGVWQAGGGYVPLDPSFPASRLAAMLESSSAEVVLAERHLLGLVAGGPVDRHVVCLETLCEPPAADFSDGGALPGNLAYVLYTSGSTGRPKGVAVEHRQLAHYTAAALDRLDLGGPARFATVSTLAADLGHTSLFPSLASGGTLHVLSAGRAADPEAMSEYMEQRQIEVLKIVPSHLRALHSARRPEAVLPRRRLVLGGEALPWAEVDAVRTLAPGCTVFNHYGPTESTVGVLTHRIAGDEPRRGATVPLGRPLARVRCVVVDAAGHPVPPGVSGELYLGGAGVARGYLSRPELTAERFVPDPFSGLSGERLYRTGDLVRYLADGRLDFLGRIDHQVKIRGYRVELGEVEWALAAQSEVAQAVVVARQWRGELQLVGYVVPAPAASVVPEALRVALRHTLPEPLVPAALVVLAELPLTPNGKVDRRALPPPDDPGTEAAAHVAPRSERERGLAEIWTELLGIEGIGAHDDFFALGGHSLLAMRLLSRVRERFRVEIPMRALFEAPTVAQLALRLVEAEPSELPASGVPPLGPSPLRRAGLPLPCSFAQRRLWFLQQLHPTSIAYNVPAALDLAGELVPAVLQGALTEVVRRHEILRTTFELVGSEPVQIVAPPQLVPLPLIDLEVLPAAAGAAELSRQLASEGGRPFDLSTGPLLRASLLRLSSSRHVLLLTLHHIVSDGWSRGLLFDEVAALYTALLAGRRSPLAELPLQYGDFADWQHGWLTGEKLAEQVEFWRGRLAGAPPHLELPTDRPRLPVRSEKGARRPVVLALPAQVWTFVRAERATPFGLLLTAFQMLLARLAGQADVSVGTPVAGRQWAELERLIGLFLNTLVLRADLSDDPPFRLALARNRDALLEMHAHQDAPFEKLVEELRPVRNLASTPFFQAMLVFQSFPRGSDQLPGITMRPLDIERDTAKVDVLLSVMETSDGFAGGLEYSSDLFDRTTMERLHHQLAVLLTGAVTDPARRLSELPLLSAPERHQLMAEWNDTLRQYELDRPLTSWLTAQATRTPQAVAVIDGEHQLTYGELAARAGRLAAHLLSLGVGPEVLVGLCAERSAEMVVGLLGILQAGGAYVPLDPEYPADRLAFMLSDSQVPVLLVQEHLLGRLPEPPCDTRVLGLSAALGQAESAGVAASGGGASAGNLAYVIYTSGSTGRPKGAMNPHRGVVNRLLWMQEAYGLGPADRVLQKTPFSFDVSVWELFWPLLVGAPLVLARPGGHRDPGYLVELITEREVTTAHFVPSMLQVFVEEPSLERCRSLRRVVASGEALPSDLVARFLSRLGGQGVELHNLYGPTEAAVDVTAQPCGEESAVGAVSIGRPIANCRILLLDGAFSEVPLGVAGELMIGGVQVARGYWQRPGLTAERFIPDSSSPSPGARLYRTGDLARQRVDGSIEYLGRLDHQVKVRGIRVELGEIEAALAACPEVREAVVVARGQGLDLQLVAYIVPAAGCDVSVLAIKRALRRTIPEPLVPSVIIVLPELPLNPNGKVDRRALPAPESPVETSILDTEPRSELERALAGIWAELLGIERIGAHDDFFALGGHSLLAALLAARVRRDLGLVLPVATVFEAPTLEALATRLSSTAGQANLRSSGLVRLRDGGPAPPLVLVHPVGGDVACYVELARQLGPEQAVWGIRSAGLVTGEPRETIEAMAEDYLAAIRDLSPHGPYRLAGWSLGGVVAFEMARRLASAGETVELLALLDSRAPAAFPEEPPDDAALLAGLARDLSGLSGRSVILAVEGLEKLSTEAGLAVLLAAAIAAGALPVGLDEEAVARLWRVYRSNLRAARAYRGEPYPGRLLVVTADRNRGAPASGWDRLAAVVESETVAADHYSLVRPPAVGELVAHLRRRLAGQRDRSTDRGPS